MFSQNALACEVLKDAYFFPLKEYYSLFTILKLIILYSPASAGPIHGFRLVFNVIGIVQDKTRNTQEVSSSGLPKNYYQSNISSTPALVNASKYCEVDSVRILQVLKYGVYTLQLQLKLHAKPLVKLVGAAPDMLALHPLCRRCNHHVGAAPAMQALHPPCRR